MMHLWLILILIWPWLGRLAFVPDGVSKSMADLRLKGLWLRLDHLRVGERQHWHLCSPCIALDLTVQFKLYAGIRTWTQIWDPNQLGSSGPHCTRWVDNQHRPVGFESQLVSKKKEFMCFKRDTALLSLYKLGDSFTYLASNISFTKSDVNIRRSKSSTAIDRILTIWKSDFYDKRKREFS